LQGHLHCLRYAHENKCNWTHTTTYNAAHNGHLDCLHYAHKHGCKWNDGVLYISYFQKHAHCLKYAVAHNCPYIFRDEQMNQVIFKIKQDTQNQQNKAKLLLEHVVDRDILYYVLLDYF
jgi:hypothetical protein